jgi:hypothetical protein
VGLSGGIRFAFSAQKLSRAGCRQKMFAGGFILKGLSFAFANWLEKQGFFPGTELAAN